KAASIYERVYEMAKKANNTLGQYDALNNMGSSYISLGDNDKAIEKYQKARAIIEKTDRDDSKLTTIYNLGWAYSRKDDLDKALEYYNEGQTRAEEKVDTNWQATFYKVLGQTYRMKGLFLQSIEAYQNAIGLFEVSKDTVNVARSLLKIGVAYRLNEDIETALQYIQKAKLIAQEQELTILEGSCLNAIGQCYLEVDQAEKALPILRQSIAIYKEQKFEKNLSDPLITLGKCYLQLNQVDSAKIFLEEGYERAAAFKFYSLMSNAKTQIGKIESLKNNPALAIQHYRSAIDFARTIGQRQYEMEAAYPLAQVLKEQGNINSSYQYLQRYTELRDSLFNVENTRKIATITANYEFEKEKQELLFQNEKEKLDLDNQIATQRRITTIIITSFVVLLGLLFFVYRLQRQKREASLEQAKLEAELNEQKLYMEQRRKEQLKEMDEFKSKVLTEISHDFRSSLTIISGMANQIQHKPEQWLDKGLKMIQQNTKKLINLFNKILELRYMEINSNTDHLIEANAKTSIDLTESVISVGALEIKQNGTADTEKPHLLIVEDNKDMAQVLVAELEDYYQVQVAHDGLEGIEKAIEEVPDLIISDVMMPKKNGYELCDALKKDERTNHIPIVLLTAKSDLNSRIAGLEKGADAYLGKPFEPKELHIRLNKLLVLRKILQQKYSSLEPIVEKTAEDAFIKKLRTLIEENLSDQDFGIPEICKALAISRSPLYRKIKALTGLSAALYIRSIRLKRAKELLEKTDMNISEIAYEVGFKHPRYFSEVYHKQYDIWPSQEGNRT
ncbi:MAG: tetratricopeptide repeat protein, partial [Bacteroidota bacterium]